MGDVHRLLTNLLDVNRFLTRERIMLAHKRGEAELVFDEQKTLQDPAAPRNPPTCAANLPTAYAKNETPSRSDTSSSAHSSLKRPLKARNNAHLDIDRLSFTACLYTLQTRLPECLRASPLGQNAFRRVPGPSVLSWK